MTSAKPALTSTDLISMPYKCQKINADFGLGADSRYTKQEYTCFCITYGLTTY